MLYECRQLHTVGAEKLEMRRLSRRLSQMDITRLYVAASTRLIFRPGGVSLIPTN